MDSFIRRQCRHIYGKPGLNHRGNRPPHDFATFKCQHCAWHLDYYRLYFDAYNPFGFTRHIGRFIWQSQTFQPGVCYFHDRFMLCAMSQTGDQLIIFRFLQGVGGALLMANSAGDDRRYLPRNNLVWDWARASWR